MLKRKKEITVKMKQDIDHEVSKCLDKKREVEKQLEKAREKWYTKYLNSGLFSTTNAAISISAVIFAAVGTVAYYTQSNA